LSTFFRLGLLECYANLFFPAKRRRGIRRQWSTRGALAAKKAGGR
jgi:hypothetical protein